MTSVAEIRKKIEELQAMEAELVQSEYQTAVNDVQETINKNKIRISDLKFDAESRVKTPKPKATVKKVPTKYRDTDGNTWSGRGLKPKWLSSAIAAGKTLESFLV